MATLFRENGIDYDRVDYFIKPLTAEKLRGLFKKADLRPIDVVRKKEKIYNELNIGEDTPDDKIIDLMVKHPSLLQRPIVEVGDKAVLARPAERALDLIAEARK
ncbi:MAG: ArsC/Spx/MgsR family protein [Pyrinomonadaceae bacterium]